MTHTLCVHRSSFVGAVTRGWYVITGLGCWGHRFHNRNVFFYQFLVLIDSLLDNAPDMESEHADLILEVILEVLELHHCLFLFLDERFEFFQLGYLQGGLSLEDGSAWLHFYGHRFIDHLAKLQEQQLLIAACRHTVHSVHIEN